MAVRGVPLEGAIEQFVDATGLAVAYDPTLVEGKIAYCAVENETAENVLECLLEDSGLDFYRLSSGTYVLTVSAEVEPERGFLAGLVRDGETGAPLPQAHVYLVDAGFGSVTNETGRFILPPLLPGRYAVRVTHLGYHTWQDTLLVHASRQTHTEAALQPEPILITPVIIDGLRPTAGLVGSADDRFVTPGLDGRISDRSSYPALSTLPGVRMHDVTADVHVQGGDAGEHELRLDNVPVYLPRASVGLIGPFSTFALDRITVHKAGFTANLGSHTAGVVQAEHAIDNRKSIDVQVDPFSFNSRVSLSPRVPGATEVAVLAALRTGLWDVYRSSKLEEMLEAWETHQPSLHFTDLHAAGRIRFGPLRTLYASVYRGGNEVSGEYSMGGGSAPSILARYDDAYDWNNTLGQLRYDAVIGSRTLFSTQVRASSYQLTHHYTVLDSLSRNTQSPVPELALYLSPVRDGNEVRTFSLESTFDRSWHRHHFSAGVEATRTSSAFSLLGVRFASRHLSLQESQFVHSPELASDQYTSGRAKGVSHAPTGWRFAAYASDRLTASKAITIEPGVRLTYVPDRATVYAEPRFSMRLDGDAGPFGAWSSRTAAGIYRQFTAQIDVSTINPGTLLPSVRVWLPLDETVRPPLSYHLTQELLFQPLKRLSLRTELYYKHQPHLLAIRYAPVGEQPLQGRASKQYEFLTNGRGEAYGGSVTAEWSGISWQIRGLYEYSHAVRHSDALFEGRTVTVPWNEPHHVQLGLDWRPLEGLIVSTRGRGIWGRTWGFRQTYYDYLGHSDSTRFQGRWDMGRPDEHVLPAFLQLDFSIAYALKIRQSALQVRLDVLNVTDRANVADWSLVSKDGVLVKEARHFYPRIPALAVRLEL